jgi:hypothetical protein
MTSFKKFCLKGFELVYTVINMSYYSKTSFELSWRAHTRNDYLKIPYLIFFWTKYMQYKDI